MSDARADRLRERRDEVSKKAEGAQKDESDEQSQEVEPSEPSETSKPSETDEPEQTDETDESDEPSVKDERVGTYMYLPESQKNRLKRRYNVLKADYEFEYDDELEKNRHFYPLVAEYGLESLDGLEPSEVRSRLQKNDWL